MGTLGFGLMRVTARMCAIGLEKGARAVGTRADECPAEVCGRMMGMAWTPANSGTLAIHPTHKASVHKQTRARTYTHQCRQEIHILHVCLYPQRVWCGFGGCFRAVCVHHRYRAAGIRILSA